MKKLSRPAPSPKLLDYYTSLEVGSSTDDATDSHEYNVKFEQMKANLNFLKKIKGHPLEGTLAVMVLRSMKRALYSCEAIGHFGLAKKYYAHFTSPIRRLSDLATHRIIHKVMLESKRPEQYASYAKRAAVAASDAEIRAVNAERRIENMYKALYMSEHIGDEFSAVINSVTSFGIFVELENTCEGLIPISELDGVFVFDEKTLTVRSRDVRFSLAERVRVRLEEADVMRGKLRFSILYKED